MIVLFDEYINDMILQRVAMNMCSEKKRRISMSTYTGQKFKAIVTQNHVYIFRNREPDKIPWSAFRNKSPRSSIHLVLYEEPDGTAHAFNGVGHPPEESTTDAIQTIISQLLEGNTHIYVWACIWGSVAGRTAKEERFTGNPKMANPDIDPVASKLALTRLEIARPKAPEHWLPFQNPSQIIQKLLSKDDIIES